MMQHINLLPWRSNKQHRNRKFLLQLFAIMLGLCLSMIFLFTWQLAKQTQNQKNTFITLQQKSEVLKNNLKTMDQIKEKAKSMSLLLEKIKELKSTQDQNAIFLNRLAHYIPDDIYILQIDRMGNRYKLIGKSKSKQAISHFMQAFTADLYFSQIKLQEIQSDLRDSVYGNEFILQIEISKSDQESKACL